MPTRLLLRHDQEAAWFSLEQPPTLDRGEMVFSASTGVLKSYLGTNTAQEFSSSVYLAAGAANTEPLVYRTSDAVSEGNLVVYEDGGWSSDATPIVWNISSSTGAVQYTAATDTWATTAALTIITDADGGSFSGSFTAPAFSPGYDPTIGESS